MTSQTGKKKLTIKRLILVIIFLPLVLHISIISIDSLISTINPFRGEEKKQIKPIYEAIIEGIEGTRLREVYINSIKNYVYFEIEFEDKPSKDKFGRKIFTEDQIETVYKATQQLIAYLNENDWTRALYEEYKIIFNFGGRFTDSTSRVRYIDGQAAFYSIDFSAYNDITDIYMMEDVRRIRMVLGPSDTIDEERAERISRFKNLEYIIIHEYTDKELPVRFAKIINKNNPDCRIFMVSGGEHIEITVSD